MYLSVAMCTYNGEAYIREQILSIYNQTTPVDEIIICDDCSEDNTVKIIQELMKHYDLPIQLYQNPYNYSYQKNFEQALCRCSGDIIFLSDQDDIWSPTKVTTIVNYFECNPSKEFIFTNAILVNSAGVSSFNQNLFDVLGLDKKNLQLFDNGYACEVLSIYCRVMGATCALRASLLPYCIPLSNVIPHDEMIAIIAALQNKIGYINQCLIKYRQHDKQTVGLKGAIKFRPKHWEYTENISSWHLGLIEPNDEKSLTRLQSIYLRFHTIRSRWALVGILNLYLSMHYKDNYSDEMFVFRWDLQTVFLRLYNRFKSLKRIKFTCGRKDRL